jgi:PST family polysaccharide transporter
MLPVRQLSAPAAKVAVPAFSRDQHDPERFERSYLGAVNVVMWISAPLFGFLFVAAQPIIVLVLGEKWIAASSVFQILTVSSLGQLLLESLNWLFISRGESEKLTRFLLMLSPCLIVAIFIALPFGIEAVAFAISLVLVGVFPFLMRFTIRGTQLTLRKVGTAILHPIATSILGVCFAEAVLNYVHPRAVVMQLALMTVCCVGGYTLALAIPSVRREILNLKSLSNSLRTVTEA